MADDWHWSDWITPSPVALKANISAALAGAGASVTGSSDPNVALDAVRAEGGATNGGFSNPEGLPYSYQSDPPLDGDEFTQAFEVSAYDNAGGFVIGDTATSYANLQVGYTSGIWRERPDYRDVPAEFWDLAETDYVPIDPTAFGWERVVEFEPGVATVAVEWADVWFHVSALAGPNAVGGAVGYTAGIPLPPVTGWSGSFGSWPPPLGGQIASWSASSPPPDQPLPAQPAPGTDFTITVYSDMAVAAAAPATTAYQRWFVRPHGGPLGESLFIWYQMPRFRYRIPGPAAQPRFFVKHWDDTMRPVGFGKPATEQTVFRTLVQGGWYRDLTTAEYATYGPGVRPPGGYPLSVKRVTDGGEYWWDQVAWLVPE